MASALKRRVVSVRAGYNRWARVYDGDGNPLTALEGPVVRRLLGPVRGLAVADVGCGTGRHSLALARRGAKVTGIDFSEGMLARAREKAGAGAVRFLRHDVSRRLPLRGGSFDRVLSCLVLEHIRDLDAFFRELARLCRPGGEVVVTTMHPAMMLKGLSARFTDPSTGERLLPRSRRQSLSDYVLAAVRADLRLADLVELAPTPRLARSFPRARKHVGWPMLVAMRLRRP